MGRESAVSCEGNYCRGGHLQVLWAQEDQPPQQSIFYIIFKNVIKYVNTHTSSYNLTSSRISHNTHLYTTKY